MTNESWLDQLEKKLEEKFSEFLQFNPYQQSLLTKESQKDLFKNLKTKQTKLLESAELHRRELLDLAQHITEWEERAKRARQAKEKDLANKVQEHIESQMSHGRTLWKQLNQLGMEFKKLEEQIASITEKKNTNSSCNSLDERWNQFEINQELEQLHKQKQ